MPSQGLSVLVWTEGLNASEWMPFQAKGIDDLKTCLPCSRTSSRDFHKTGPNQNSRRFLGDDARLLKFRFSPMLVLFRPQIHLST